MKKIKLLYVSSSADSVHDYRFLKQLSLNPDIDVFLATPQDESEIYPETLQLNINIKILRSKLDRIRTSNLYIYRLIRRYKKIYFVNFIKEIIKKYEINLIHSGWLTSDSYYALKTGFHPVLAMGWGSDVLNNQFMRNPHNSRTLLKRLKYVVKNADAIYSDANVVAQTLIDLTGIEENKLHIFPQLGVDINKFKPDLKLRQSMRNKFKLNNEKLLIMTRNLWPIYGVEDFISSLPAVLSHHPKVKVCLIGDGPLREKILLLIERLSLKNFVFYVGSVDNNKLPAYYNMADIYVSTSLSDGSSISLMEAMACGLPAVVTDVPANLEWIRDGYNGCVAKRQSINSISTKIIELLSSENNQRSYGEQNLKIAYQKFDIEKNYIKLLNLYESILH